MNMTKEKWEQILDLTFPEQRGQFYLGITAFQ
jgi:hypothetical protein